MSGVIGDILTGKRVSRDRLGQAAVGVAAGIFAVLGGAAATASGGVGRQQQGPVRFTPFAPFAPFSPLNDWPHQPPPRPRPPPVDPAVAELALERMRSRRVMGLGATFTHDELKTRYRALAKKHHPDRKGGSVSAMAAVNHANDVLSAEIG